MSMYGLNFINAFLLIIFLIYILFKHFYHTKVSASSTDILHKIGCRDFTFIISPHPYILIYYFLRFRIVFISVIPVLVCCSVIILVRLSFFFSVIRIEIIFDITYTILYIISDFIL